jgi:hypothetical protein
VSDIFREVDEDVRNDRWMALWQQYGIYLITAVVVIVLAVAGRAFWINYTNEKQAAESTQYDSAISLILAGDDIGGLNKLEEIVGNTSSTYADLASFKIASQYIANDDKLAALTVYDGLKENSNVDEKLQGLASLLGAIIALDVESNDQAHARLLPLAVYGESWYYSAQEFLALLALRSGKTAEAISIYSDLVNDQVTPAGIKQRSGEILSVIDVISPIVIADEVSLEEVKGE